MVPFAIVILVGLVVGAMITFFRCFETTLIPPFLPWLPLWWWWWSFSWWDLDLDLDFDFFAWLRLFLLVIPLRFLALRAACRFSISSNLFDFFAWLRLFLLVIPLPALTFFALRAAFRSFNSSNFFTSFALRSPRPFVFVFLCSPPCCCVLVMPWFDVYSSNSCFSSSPWWWWARSSGWCNGWLRLMWLNVRSAEKNEQKHYDPFRNRSYASQTIAIHFGRWELCIFVSLAGIALVKTPMRSQKTLQKT